MIALYGLIADFAMVAGLLLVCAAIFRLKKHGEMRGGGGQSKASGAFIWLFIGGLLIALPQVLNLYFYAVWGTHNPNTYPGGGDIFGELDHRIVLIVMVFGCGMFVKALTHFSKMGSEQTQPGTIGKAVLYLCIAALCINISAVANLIENLVEAFRLSS